MFENKYDFKSSSVTISQEGLEYSFSQRLKAFSAPTFTEYTFKSLLYHENSDLFYMNWRKKLHSDLSLSPHKFLESGRASSLDIDIDRTESRYLLSSGSDFKIKIFDLFSDGDDLPSENSDSQRNKAKKRKRGEDDDLSTARGPKIREDENEVVYTFRPKETATVSTPHVSHLRPVVEKTMSQTNVQATATVGTIQWFPVDTGIFVTGSFDHNVRVWDTNRMQSVKRCRFPEKVYKVAMSKCMVEPLVCVGTGQREVSCVDIRTGNVSQQFIGHRDGTWAIDWHPHNPYHVVTGSLDGTMRLWDIRKIGMLIYYDISNTSRSKKSRDSFNRFSTENFSTKMKVPPAHPTGVTSLQFTNDGRKIISVGKDEEIRVWDTNTGENELVSFQGVRNSNLRSHRFALDPDDEYLYYPMGNNIHIFHIGTGTFMKQIEGHFSPVTSCIFQPSSNELYSCASDQQILVFSPTELNEMRKKVQIEVAPQVINEEENWSEDDIWG